MKVGDIIIAKEEALKEYSFALNEHRFFKIVRKDDDTDVTELVSIQSDDVKLIGSINLTLFCQLSDIEAVNNLLIGLLTASTKIISFEAKTACGKTIKID